MANKRVVLGEDFDSLEAKVTTESPEVIRAKTQANIAYGTLAAGAAALLASAALGLYKESFNELQSVWNVSGPILGGIFGHYFGRPENDSATQ